MASIKMISESEATGKVKDTYEEIKARLGIDFVPNLYKVMASKPDYLEDSVICPNSGTHRGMNKSERYCHSESGTADRSFRIRFVSATSCSVTLCRSRSIFSMTSLKRSPSAALIHSS